MSLYKITPTKQGDLDGACGFYSIVNALTALEKDLDPNEVFTQVIAAFMEDGKFTNFFDGTYRGTIKNVLSRVIEYFNTNYAFYDDKSLELYNIEFSMPYWFKDTPRSRKQVMDHIAQADGGKECICIVGYGHDDGGHWSVVKKVSEKGLHMLDSSKYTQAIIPFNDIGVVKGERVTRRKPCNLYSGDIFVIRKKWLGEIFEK